MRIEDNYPTGSREAFDRIAAAVPDEGMRPRPFRQKRGDEGMDAPAVIPSTKLVPGVVYQLGRKALAVEIRDGEPVLVQLAEAPR